MKNATKINTQKNKKYFWEKENVLYFILIFFLAFTVFYFSGLGHYTNRKTGEMFNATRQFWFAMLVDSVFAVLLITPCVFWGYYKLRRKDLDIKILKIIALGYFAIFAFTLAIFTLQTITQIVLANPYYTTTIEYDVDFVTLAPINSTINSLSIETFNMLATDYAYGLTWFVTILIIFLFMLFFSTNKSKRSSKSFAFHYRNVKDTNVRLAGFAFFCLMLAAFGLGVFGLNFDTSKSALTFINNGTGNSSNFPGLWLKAFNNNTDKSSFWGVNNNWSGYLIFAIMLFFAFYVLFLFIYNTVAIANNKKIYNLKEKDYTFESFMAFIIVITGIYLFDRYIIVNVDGGSWNPNLFNGLIYLLAISDYHGTVYYWTMFALLPLLSLPWLFLLNKPVMNKFTIARNNFYLKVRVFIKF